MQRYYLQEPTYTKKEKLYLAAPTVITKADSKLGIVDAFVSVMGNVDLMDDIIHSGAFNKTISDNGTDFRVLDNHNFFSVMDAVGTVLSIEERPRKNLPESVQAKFPDATGGLFTSTQFMLDDEKSRGVFNRIKSGAVNQFSIGFQIAKQDFSEENFGTDDEPDLKTIRNIREIKLFEFSPVLFAANTATAVAGVKNFIPITLDNLKRAETKHNCSTCVFFGKFAGDVGYCKKNNGTTKVTAICDEYDTDGSVKTTYSDAFKTHMSETLDTVFKIWNTKTDIALTESIPTMVDAIASMLPQEMSDMAYETHDDNEQPSSTSDNDTEAATETTLSENDRVALMKRIRTRQIENRQEKYGV